MPALGLAMRAGIHTGECERVGDKLAGLAVSIGARVAAAAGAGRGARLGDGAGSGRRLGLRLRGSRRAGAEGRAGLVAAVAGGSVNRVTDALIVDAVRSPIGRRNGSLAGTRGDELAARC